jgi:proteasome component ECM29
MLKQEQTEVRFCAIRWATSLFDLHHCPSRYICMLGASDTRLDIRSVSLFFGFFSHWLSTIFI